MRGSFGTFARSEPNPDLGCMSVGRLLEFNPNWKHFERKSFSSTQSGIGAFERRSSH